MYKPQRKRFVFETLTLTQISCTYSRL